MNNERIDLDAIESEWDNYQSDGPIDDYLASLNISRMIAELKRCYELIDGMEDEGYPEPDELTPSNTSRAGADWPSGPRM